MAIVGEVDRYAVETALSAVPGVASAVVDVDPTDATVGVMRLALDTGADEVVVATAVNKVLRMQFGLGVDADRIEMVMESAVPRRLSAVAGDESASEGQDEAAEGDAVARDNGVLIASMTSATAAGDSTLTPDRMWGGALTKDGGDFPADVVSAAIRHPSNRAEPVVRGVERAEPKPTTRKRQRTRKPPPPGTTPIRMEIERLQVTPADPGVAATVTLSRAGRHHVGIARGIATSTGVHRAVADATVVAAADAAHGRVQLAVANVDIPSIGGKRVAVVQVKVTTVEGVERLTGASEVREDTRHAVVRATLDAINRRLESVLARPIT